MTAAKNMLEQRLNKAQTEVGQPAHEQDRIGYATIEDINEATSQVKIRLMKSDGSPGNVLAGGFLPLINPLDDIHNRFGALRKHMVCRIFWRGKMTPRNVLVEVIGPEDHNFLSKKPAANLVDVGPYAIFSGGVS